MFMIYLLPITVRMSILASREHTCVHPYVSLSKNKNEDCQKMVDPLRVCVMGLVDISADI